MAVTLDAIIDAFTTGQTLDATFRKAGTLAELAGWPHSLWRVGPVPAAGGDGAAGSGTPGAGGTALDQADGSLSMGWDDHSPNIKILLESEVRSTLSGVIVVCDRLVSVSGIALSSTGNKNIGSAALPRYTDGKNVRPFLEVTTATATTAPIVTLNSYTDQDNNTGQSGTAITFPAAATNVDTLIPLPLAAADYGIRAAATLNVGTAGSAGVANFILVKEIARIIVAQNEGRGFQHYRETMQFDTVEDGASLMLYYIPSTTTAITIDGAIGGVYVAP
jgi:hypothetical protein